MLRMPVIVGWVRCLQQCNGDCNTQQPGLACGLHSRSFWCYSQQQVRDTWPHPRHHARMQHSSTRQIDDGDQPQNTHLESPQPQEEGGGASVWRTVWRTCGGVGRCRQIVEWVGRENRKYELECWKGFGKSENSRGGERVRRNFAILSPRENNEHGCAVASTLKGFGESKNT